MDLRSYQLGWRRGKRKLKSYEAWRRKYVGDLRHMHRCCLHGRLPKENCEYLEDVLRDEHSLPKPREVAKRVHFTNEQRERNRLWTIPPVDMTTEQLADQRREKDRQRKTLARRRARALSREAYLAAIAGAKPWLKEGISRATWFRRQAVRRGSSQQQSHRETGFVRAYLSLTPEQPSLTPSKRHRPRASREGVWVWPRQSPDGNP